MKKLILFLGFIAISFSSFAQIDYQTDIEPIISANCNSCHTSGENGFDSTPYADLIASMSPSSTYNKKHIIPNDADGSPIVDKISSDNPQFGERMPQGGSLTTDQINKIRQWINEGATEEVATSIDDEVGSPNEFELLGNYPNPFNPATSIQFKVPTTSDFQIAVYNANGQLVQKMNGRASAGLNEQSIELTNQSSGVYFYRVRATTNGLNSLIGSGKMTLVK